MPFATRIQRSIARSTLSALAATCLVSGLTAYAIDGTEGATPPAEEVPTACVIVPAHSGAMDATPVASAVASPIVSASPVASPVVATPETGSSLQGDIEATAKSIFSCVSENNADTLVKITSDSWRASLVGVDGDLSATDYAQLVQTMPRVQYELVSVSDVTQSSDTSATAVVTYRSGNQLHTGEWSLTLRDVEGHSVWTLDSEQSQTAEAPAGSASLSIEATDSAFTINPASIEGTSATVSVSNTGSQDHEVLILRVPEGTTAADIAAAPTGIPEGGMLVGQVTIPAGGEGSIVLVHLEAGTYTVVDLLPDANGIPNVSNGLYGTFEVTN